MQSRGGDRGGPEKKADKWEVRRHFHHEIEKLRTDAKIQEASWCRVRRVVSYPQTKDNYKIKYNRTNTVLLLARDGQVGGV